MRAHHPDAIPHRRNGAGDRTLNQSWLVLPDIDSVNAAVNQSPRHINLRVLKKMLWMERQPAMKALLVSPFESTEAIPDEISVIVRHRHLVFSGDLASLIAGKVSGDPAHHTGKGSSIVQTPAKPA